MNDSSKIKWLAALVVVLVLLNIMMMGYLWYAPKATVDINGPRDGRGPAGLVIKELKFNDNQQSAFEKLREDHRAAMRGIDKDLRDLHNQLFKTLSDERNTEGQKASSDSLIIQIAERQKLREQVTYAHLMEVRKLCNADQKQIFDDMIVKAGMRRPMGPPPGMRDGPPPPPGDRP